MSSRVGTNSGPIPKRESQRRRRNNENGQRDVTRAPGASDVVTPDPSPEWHPAARGWFDSLAASGQSAFYEPSDWWEAYFIAEAMSRNLNQGAKFSAVLFSSIVSAMGELLTSEGSRRRVRLELERSGVGDEDEDASVSELNAYRKRLHG